MQRALTEALSELDSPTLPGEALEELMRSLFPDRIGEKEEMLRRLKGGGTPSHLPAADVDIEVELPSVHIEHFATSPKRSQSAFVLAMVVAIVGVAAVAGWWTRPSDNDSSVEEVQRETHRAEPEVTPVTESRI